MFPRFQFTICQALVQVIAWCLRCDKPALPEPRQWWRCWPQWGTNGITISICRESAIRYNWVSKYFCVFYAHVAIFLSYRICVVLLTRNVEAHDVFRASFRRYAQDHYDMTERVRYAYVYEDTQFPFVNKLTRGEGIVNDTQLKVSDGDNLTLNVRGPSYLGLTRSISWLLMPWLLTSPGHQQPWYWLCRIGSFLSYLRKDFNYLRRINVEKWHKM